MRPEFYRKRLKDMRIDDALQGGVDWKSVKEKSALIFQKHIKGQVLDAGCGTGWVAEFIDKDDYVGMDWFREAIDEARKRHPQHKFVVGDVRKTGFNDKSFDWVIASSLGGYAPDGLGKNWEAYEKEWSRISNNILVLWLSKPGQYKIITYGTI